MTEFTIVSISPCPDLISVSGEGDGMRSTADDLFDGNILESADLLGISELIRVTMTKTAVITRSPGVNVAISSRTSAVLEAARDISDVLSFKRGNLGRRAEGRGIAVAELAEISVSP